MSSTIAPLKPDQELQDLPTFTYADLHAAINALWGIQWRWGVILTETDQLYLQPEPWETNFAVAWLNPDQASDLYEERRREARRIASSSANSTPLPSDRSSSTVSPTTLSGDVVIQPLCFHWRRPVAM